MEWFDKKWEWVTHEAAQIGMLDLGLLIVGGIVGSLLTWWRHRTLKAQLRILQDGQAELLAMMRSMEGRTAEEQRSIVAKAEGMLRASISTGAPTTVGNLSVKE